MLLPRFSLKLMLLLNAAFALVFFVAKFAVDGQDWAVGVVMSVVAAALLMLLFAAMFFAAYALSIGYRGRRSASTESPFATDRLPPQVIPPRHADD